jgi:hypothetical protein
MISCSRGHLAIELTLEGASRLDVELIRHVADGVLHYFREELGREAVTVGEFAAAFSRVLRSFGLEMAGEPEVLPSMVVEIDLAELAGNEGRESELFFFPRVRQELRRRLADCPETLRLTGLRTCVKRLTGARRWTARCQELNDRIVDFLRSCVAETRPLPACALVVL